jgi:tetratricopeptide (TPR) repeat protein
MLASNHSKSESNLISNILAIALRYAGVIGWLMIAFAVIIYLQDDRLKSIKKQDLNLTKAEIEKNIAAEKARLSLIKGMPSFGFDNIVANWQFMDFLQYFGDGEARQKAGYSIALDYFDIILDRDPRFVLAYYYLSNTGSLYAGEPEKSVGLMERGLKYLTPQVPDRGYYIWRLKGVDELLFMGNVGAAQKSMLTASKWARQYPNRESQLVAQISLNTANYLARNPKSKQAQFDAWNMVLNNAIEERVIKRAIVEIQALGGKVTMNPDGRLRVQAPKND